MRASLLIVAIAAWTLLSPPPLRACELCRDSTPIPTKADAPPTPTLNFNTSIFWMLGAIGAVGSFAGTTLYRALRQNEANEPQINADARR